MGMGEHGVEPLILQQSTLLCPGCDGWPWCVRSPLRVMQALLQGPHELLLPSPPCRNSYPTGPSAAEETFAAPVPYSGCC